MPSKLATLTRILLAAVLGIAMALADTAVAGDWEPRTSESGDPADEIETEQEGDERNDDTLAESLPSAAENERLAWNQGRERLWPTGAHSPAVFRPPE
jgi:hypothetical protein